MKKIRIGSGAGYGGDRLDPAIKLMQSAELDYIGFECLAERTIALAQKEKLRDPAKGYNHLLEYRMEKVLPLASENKIKVITNMGAANPVAAASVVKEMAMKMGLEGLKIAAVTGDDVFEIVKTMPDLPILENGLAIGTMLDKMVSANAYLGVEGIVEALRQGADIIITGRVADPALFLAPMVFEFGWSESDYELLGKGTMVGHLLECAGQVCGGYFADGHQKQVPDLWDLGFPFVEIDQKGIGHITKVSGTGGIINKATCTEQLLYEIHDPAAYYTPDCVADFSRVEFYEKGEHVVEFTGASGKSATPFYKVSVGYENGFVGEGQISYGGYQCEDRADLAIDILKKRLQAYDFEALRFDLIGMNASLRTNTGNNDFNELRVRVCGKAKSREEAIIIGREVEALYTNGPAGGGGATMSVEELISVVSVLIPKALVTPKVTVETV